MWEGEGEREGEKERERKGKSGEGQEESIAGQNEDFEEGEIWKESEEEQ